MCKQSTLLISAVCLLAIVAGAQAGIEGHWNFDEGSGAVAHDSSGNGRDGTVSGASWASPGSDGTGSCLDFDGQGTNRISLGTFSISGNAISLACWFKADNLDTPGNDPRMISKAIGGANDEHWFMISSSRQSGVKVLRFRLKTDGSTGELKANTSTGTIETDVWTHVAATWDGQTMRIYKNGEEVGSLPKSGSLSTDDTVKVSIGNQPEGTGDRPFEGLIDEVLIADRAMSEAQVQALVAGTLPDWRKALGPSPADGADHGATWVSLGWTTGETAASHDVYLGESFDDVSNDDVTGATYRGNHNTAVYLAGLGLPGDPYPDGLASGMTYYWRIDEVEADGVTSIKGEVWSFTIPPRKAYDPSPADGAEFVAQDVQLTWTAGLDAKMHTVYFGDDADTVGSATDGTNTSETTHTPGDLEEGKTYYWRVDQLNPPAVVKGDVWSFTTVPILPVVDPSLLGWWKFDEGQGDTAVDWSGHSNHGRLIEAPQWVDGYDGGALDFEYANSNDGVSVKPFDVDTGGITLGAWIKPESFSQNDGRIITKASGTGGNDHWWMLSTISSEGNYVLRFRLKTDDGQDTTTLIAGSGLLAVDEWAHAGATWDGTSMVIYKDGVEVGREVKGGTAVATNPNLAIAIGNHFSGTTGNRAWDGMIDDVRVYNKALTADEIKLAMRGDTTRAWNPSPPPGSTPDILSALPLTWSAGDDATMHDVYFGTDRDAVANADASDTTGIYRGQQAPASYSPAEVEFGGGPYYWRIDEVTADGTIVKGSVWRFSVADYIVIDDFESYNDIPSGEPGSNLVYETWIDGFENPAANGSTIGYVSGASMESDTVHGGNKSVPLQFSNLAAGISEVTINFTTAQDWTAHGITTLSLWFYGASSNVPGQLYVKVNGVQVDYTGATTDLNLPQWQQWEIDLATVGANLQGVTSFAVGVQGSGANGILLLDDITLYGPTP